MASDSDMIQYLPFLTLSLSTSRTLPVSQRRSLLKMSNLLVFAVFGFSDRRRRKSSRWRELSFRRCALEGLSACVVVVAVVQGLKLRAKPPTLLFGRVD
jgi:hypothetical protein